MKDNFSLLLHRNVWELIFINPLDKGLVSTFKGEPTSSISTEKKQKTIILLPITITYIVWVSFLIKVIIKQLMNISLMKVVIGR